MDRFFKIRIKKIYNYSKEKTSISVAKILVIEITKEVENFKNQPKIGQVKQLLSIDFIGFQYLLYNNHYKIIYWLNQVKGRVEILEMFDTRQSPTKIKNTIIVLQN